MPQKEQISVKVRVIMPDGSEREEMASSHLSRRHALWSARERYRGKATVEPGEPGIL